MSKKGLHIAPVFVVITLIAAWTLAACVRSASGVVPTPVAKGEQPKMTITHGETVIVAGVTSTPVATFTPIPTMTPTPTSGEQPVPTPTPTTQPVGQATPTPAVGPTATPIPGTGFEYTVQAGDTLWGLAIRFGTTVEAIKSKNRLTSDVIYKGQKLIIPIAGGQGVERVTHVVQPGENLFRIAFKYNTTVEAIAAANNIVNPNFVYAGQKLTIVKGSGTTPVSGVRYHVVQPGETLWSIALKYNTTAWAIANYNGISNINFILAGRTLRIP